MRSRDIERLLRLPAPDEPAVLPALILPTAGSASGGVRLRRRDAGYPSRAGFGDIRLVLAVLALLAVMISAIAIGALRLDRLPNPFDPNAHFGARGVTLDYPNGWHVVAALSPFNDQGSETALIVSNTRVDGCSSDEVGTETVPPVIPSGDTSVDGTSQTGAIFALEDRIFACVMSKPLADGEIRLVLMHGYPQRIGIGPIEPFDAATWFGSDAPAGGGGFYVPSAADGWTTTIDGLPAKLVVETTSIAPGAEEVRTWGVIEPAAFSGAWFVRATLRGPDLDALRAEVDVIAQSLRFDAKPVPLDEDARDVALARALDAMDREYRVWWNSTLISCFPRTPGQREVLIEDGPEGPLDAPQAVTCATTMETITPLSLWRATVLVTWPAAEGLAAGSWGWELFFDGVNPGRGAQGFLGDGDAWDMTSFPGAGGQLPPPLDGPLVIPNGSVVEVLTPGVNAAIEELRDRLHLPVKDAVLDSAQARLRLYVIDGPVDDLGIDWYLVRQQVGGTPGQIGWVPATHQGRPLLRVVEPSCPTGEVDVGILLRLIPAEAAACFGTTELTLGPATVRLGEPPDDGGIVPGDPDWLASDSRWELYGRGGPDGVEGALRVVIAPALGDSLPTDQWLTVRGHFNDAASASCTRHYAEGWNITRVPIAWEFWCQQTFVVTSFEPSAAP